MNARRLRRYVDDLLRGRRPKPFQPDDFEAAQIRTAIDLTAARLGADAPRQEFLTDLHERLAAQLDDAPAPTKSGATRRQVVLGTSAAAAVSAAAGVSVDRFAIGRRTADTYAGGSDRQLTPSNGRWLRVAASSEVPDGVMHPFDLGTVIGFVRRVDGKPEAVSGVCTHQGCRLWFDAPDARLRCPCHSTSFAPTGQVLTHQLPMAPKPLPALMVREIDRFIEVFAPLRPGEPA
ncbi:Rieske (2Fe-2S) protein [uncultured Mycobacterium sp.]|uniref:Rieske (2Fe-2S) protein n=1 Tax=uncultured Mycobacterium sp. TaxID=171292 RepID=UPI0035CAE52B